MVRALKFPFFRTPTHPFRSGTLLNCKIHYCPSKCHQLSDHSRMRCEFPFSTCCANGHSMKWKCHDGSPATCRRCEKERRATEEAKLEQALSQEQRESPRSKSQQEMESLNELMARLMLRNKRVQAVQENGTSTSIYNRSFLDRM